MRRTWMFGFILIGLFSIFFVASAQYRDDGFEAADSEVTSTEPIVSELAVDSSLRPQARGKRKPKVTVQNAKPHGSTMMRDTNVKFTKTGKSDRQTKFFKKFQDVFQKCSKGCDAGRAHIHRPYASKTNKAGNLIRSNTCPDPKNPGKYVPRKKSCHNGNEAIDVHSLVCGGVKYSATTSRFKAFVECVETKKYQGTAWKGLFRETRKGCRGSKIDITGCHYDHAHFSLGCWRQKKKRNNIDCYWSRGW